MEGVGVRTAHRLTSAEDPDVSLWQVDPPATPLLGLDVDEHWEIDMHGNPVRLLATRYASFNGWGEWQQIGAPADAN